MKTIVIIFLVVLFLLSVMYFFACKKGECNTSQSCKTDKRAVEIQRAKKNLHPVINRSVDRDSRGRFCKKK